VKTCSDSALTLPLPAAKPVVVDFDGGDLSSDAGFAALALADQRLQLTERLAAVIDDPREAAKVEHSMAELLRERIYLIAQGYADANDAQSMREDPVLKLAVGRTPAEPALAGQSTLSRLENAVTPADLERLGDVLLTVFVERCQERARETGRAPRVVLDFDPFEDPAHGSQQGVLFNGHYDSFCYLPLYLCGSLDGGRQYVVGVLLRDGRASAVQGARWMLTRVVSALREQLPGTEVLVRGDSAFGVPKMLNVCNRLGVAFCFGKAQNARLHALSEGTQMRAAVVWSVKRRPEVVYGEFQYAAEKWAGPERVICKAEVTAGPYGDRKLNPRFVVTNLKAADGWTPAAVYGRYCERGDPENRIKEFKSDLEGDRLSCHSFWANQFRLVLHVAAYLLFQALQDALAAVAPGTQWARAQAGTIRTKLLKVAARVVERCRVVRMHLPTSYPWQALWRKVLSTLSPAGG
jgi:hypothetical protein